MSTTTPEPNETPNPAPKKVSKAEYAQRVEEIMAIRMSGAGFNDVRSYATEKGWNVSRAQLYRYQQAADDLIADTIAKDRPKLFDLHVARRRTLYARCIESGDWRAALTVIRDEALLYRLYEPAKVPLEEGKEAIGETAEAALARLKGAAARAVAHAEALLESESEPTRLAAIRTLLDACLNYREQGELATRLEQLQAVLKRRNGEKGK